MYHLLVLRCHIHKLHRYKHKGKGQALTAGWTQKTAKPCQDTKKSTVRNYDVLHSAAGVLSCHQSTWEGIRGVWGWDPTNSCAVQLARTPIACCYCHHPSSPSSWTSSFVSSNTNNFQEQREKKGTSCGTTFLMHPVCGLCPSPTNTHTNIPDRHWDLQQSGSGCGNDPISLHTGRQDMSKPEAWKEAKLWANVLENEFQTVLSSFQFIDTSKEETHVLPIKLR